MSIPNILTFLRILLIPFFILLFYLPFRGSHIVAALIFIFAAMTDWLDGYLARSWDQVSKLGSFLDPVADKLMVITALILLVSDRALPYLAIPAVVISCREIMVSALREWMAEIGKRKQMAVTMLGKIKTTLQMLAIILLLLYKPGAWMGFAFAGYLLLYFAVFLTLWSMCLYLKAAWHDLSS
ncbi:CDP-diacylglycerol--glycerol-3-phosphate 3-phosphatidyltransferase [Rickettsiella grylli]|uniref:CDP-diacylglycerol--glycerol-3-phosphate 3-phosphatidyltransferase n=1 Tax=Rickettsiella grylli TaxID=59196 RepID=UPI0008FD76AB|nr:CDP-diacylglycerol--glycerol-3-phosphate 3-phosphatidyltransferase [Rickettsiella grylli]OIZ99344.1 CDP-diacylglycerol--glycerol-3-phosphate 3-phosphatidyltransferase [Rickettsiella grylli]